MTGHRWVALSYKLDKNTPAYGNGAGVECIQDKSMAHGDSCNTSRWNFSNHLGTHLDFPRHFGEHGKTLDDYPIEFFVFKRVGFVDLGDVPSGKIISWQDLKLYDIPSDIEILLVKTGFCNKRNSPIYWQENPGFSPQLADDLRNRFPSLRILGFDSISLSSFAHRELGREAHKRFLDHDRPILPLEDMDLSHITETIKFKQVVAAPWMVHGADAAPCTVMAEVCNGN